MKIIAIVSLCIAIIIALSSATYNRNRIYLTHVTLWQSAAEASPDKRRVHENLGQALSEAATFTNVQAEQKRLLDAALAEFRRVQELPDDGSVPERDYRREIGVTYFRMGRYDDAEREWKKGLEAAPGDPGLLNNLGVLDRVRKGAK